MIQRQPDSAVHHYSVRVGHHALRVEGRDETDAIRVARRRLSEEMPRMWDLIHLLEDARFQVDEIPPQAAS